MERTIRLAAGMLLVMTAPPVFGEDTTSPAGVDPSSVSTAREPAVSKEESPPSASGGTGDGQASDHAALGLAADPHRQDELRRDTASGEYSPEAWYTPVGAHHEP